MSHLSHRSGYAELTDRLNRCPQGAPPSQSLHEILKILFSEREAELIALLPIRPFTAEKAAEVWKMELTKARNILDDLAGRAMLVDIVAEDGGTTYVLPPPMAGFFEFSMMRTRGDIDQKALAELFYQYLNVEEDFIKALFADGQTQLGRVFVQEPCSRPKTPCTCSITSGPARSSARPPTGPSAPATAVTRCSTWAATATRPRTSA
jgi:hypothetical protein